MHTYFSLYLFRVFFFVVEINKIYILLLFNLFRLLLHAFESLYWSMLVCVALVWAGVVKFSIIWQIKCLRMCSKCDEKTMKSLLIFHFKLSLLVKIEQIHISRQLKANILFMWLIYIYLFAFQISNANVLIAHFHVYRMKCVERDLINWVKIQSTASMLWCVFYFIRATICRLMYLTSV